MKRSTTIWAISDGRAGNARQAEALGEALAASLPDARCSPLIISPRAPWRWLAPRRLPGAGLAFGGPFRAALARPPTIAIGCGRQAALATRLLRGHGSYAVQILDPRVDARHWDMLVVPEHDRLRGDNVLPLLGSLNPVDETWLALGRAAFPAPGTLPGPRIALLVGGPTTQVPWSIPELAQLLDQLLELPQPASVLATVSRRTPADVTALLRDRLRGRPGLLWCDPADGPNPYAGLLGWADAIICSADSVNLLSEACATTVPVHAAFAAQARGRVGHFVQALDERGRLCAFDALLQGAAATPLRETRRIATTIATRLLANP